MSNKLITFDEAADSLAESIQRVIADCLKDGMSLQEIEAGLNGTIAALGGFPRDQEVSNG